MTEIQQNRYDQLVRRVNNIVSPGSMVNDSLNELFPTIDVETLNAELSYLSGWRLAFGSTNQPALAANNNLTQLFNPVGSGMIVVLERIDVQDGTAQIIRYGLSTTALTNLTANEALRDTRTGILPIPVAQCRDVQQVGSIAQFGMFFLRASINFSMADKRGLFVLSPGTGVTFATTVVNNALLFSYQWRERVAEPSELNF